MTSVYLRMVDLYYEIVVYTSLVIATGLFNILECYVINVVLGSAMMALFLVHQREGEDTLARCYNLGVTMVFNLIDAKLHASREIDSFNNIMQVDDKCNRISEFVDRLLPKHVVFAH